MTHSRENTYNVEVRHYDSYTGGGARVYEFGTLAKGCTAGGCGYDRNGSALANWLMTKPEFAEGIKHILANSGSGDKPTGLYGLSHYNPITHKRQKRASKNTASRVDGACGMSSVSRIVEHLGGSVLYAGGNKSSNFYIVTLKGGTK